VDAVVVGAENAHAGGRFLSWGQAVLSGYGGSGKPAGMRFGRENAGLLCDLAHCGAAAPHPIFPAHFQAIGFTE
jgi:hypothetical protein